MLSNKVLSDDEVAKMDIPLRNIIKRANGISGWARPGAEVPMFWLVLMNLIKTEKLDLEYDLPTFLSKIQPNCHSNEKTDGNS